MKKCISILTIICCIAVAGNARPTDCTTVTDFIAPEEVTACDAPAPVNLQSNIIDEHTVRLTWNDGSNTVSSGFLVRTFDDVGDVVAETIVYVPEIEISGLIEDKHYTTHVHSICSDGIVSPNYGVASFSMTIIIDLILNVQCEEPTTQDVAGNHLFAVPVTSNGASADWLPFPPNTNRIVYFGKVFKHNYESSNYARFLIVRDLNSDTVHIKLYAPVGKIKVVFTSSKLLVVSNNLTIGDLRFTPSGYIFSKTPGGSMNYGAKVDYFSSCEVSNGNNELAAVANAEASLLQPEEIGKAARADMKVSPNPFSDELDIRLQLAEEQHVSVALYNATGIRIKEIADSMYDPGIHSQAISTSDIPAGIYYIVMHTDTFSKTMMVVK